MKDIIEVLRGDGSYSQVVIGDVVSDLKQWIPSDKRVILITDENLNRLYPEIVSRYENIVIGLGEQNKTLSTYESIASQLLELGVDRGCYILGFGGGIVTDIAGFVATTYMRGLRFGFIASSLLAQVDASVGGKNGVNLNGFKNMVGTFNQPDFVLCDTSLLNTLPEREFSAGMAEIIKAGIIADPSLFELLASHNISELKSDPELLRQVITASIRVKAKVVAADEKETGERKKLNLGHTFAHAIEKCTRNFLHGEAVAIGLEIICKLAIKMGLFSKEEYKRVHDVLVAYDLPTESPSTNMQDLLKALQLDKKRDNKSVSLIIPTKIGDCIIQKISFSELDNWF